MINALQVTPYRLHCSWNIIRLKSLPQIQRTTPGINTNHTHVTLQARVIATHALRVVMMAMLLSWRRLLCSAKTEKKEAFTLLYEA
ncbi:hypothetical protein GDO81_012286 [Engystomops pustulosus]|uniref:Uncharacterized protein n=1 Tax=Engystomops pustulosus TaxID=76066 RepID=A0AAV7BL67_ENGPU|nr:hypothetical protein GDO81_012286 [Engystomops pustulosus]